MIAVKHIDGKYGNGDERKEALIKFGYDYDTIQNKVNEILGLTKYLSVLNEGDMVQLTKNAVYINGENIPQWVKDGLLYVRGAVKDDGSVLVSRLRHGDITGVVHKKYLIKL